MRRNREKRTRKGLKMGETLRVPRRYPKGNSVLKRQKKDLNHGGIYWRGGGSKKRRKNLGGTEKNG